MFSAGNRAVLSAEVGIGDVHSPNRRTSQLLIPRTNLALRALYRYILFMVAQAVNVLALPIERIRVMSAFQFVSRPCGASMFFDAALLILAIYAILFVHEIGHLAAARMVGLQVSRLTLGVGPRLLGIRLPPGLVCQIALLPIGSACVLADSGAHSPEPKRRRTADRTLAKASIGERAAIYAAGPVFNIGLAVGLVLATSVISQDFTLSWMRQVDAAAIVLIAGGSLLIGLFNLLPILPLDGGRLVLLALEAHRGRPLSSASEARLHTIGGGIIAGASALTVGGFALRYWHLL